MEPFWINKEHEEEMIYIENLWAETGKALAGKLIPVFGSGEEWYFWDEKWASACGPFSSRQKAAKFLEMYCVSIVECKETV